MNFSRHFLLRILRKVQHNVSRFKISVNNFFIHKIDKSTYDLFHYVLCLYFSDETSSFNKVLETTTVAIFHNKIKAARTFDDIVDFTNLWKFQHSKDKYFSFKKFVLVWILFDVSGYFLCTVKYMWVVFVITFKSCTIRSFSKLLSDNIFLNLLYTKFLLSLSFIFLNHVLFLLF